MGVLLERAIESIQKTKYLSIKRIDNRTILSYRGCSVGELDEEGVSLYC